MTSIDNYVTSASASLSPLEILRSPPIALLGVSTAAAAALAKLDIHSVFDLATSKVFSNALLLVEAANDPLNILNRFGMPPADVLANLPAGVAVGALQHQGLEILEGIGAANSASFAAGLNIKTVRDLALWPQYVAARDILRTVFFPEVIPGADVDAPADLLPKSGDYPTERVFYSTLVLDDVAGDPAALAPLENAGQVDIAPAAGAEFGFKKPAFGALLTFSQSWYAQAVTLGQLLHSVALAPGESTRVAMIDWSRRTLGKQSEDLSETEQLSNITDHSRALGEVTSAVAREAQSGFSESHVKSRSSEEGSGGGFSLGPVTLGSTDSAAQSASDAMSFSSSSGRRDLSASMTQNVVDHTQQQANAARNRRATVVKEVSQQEHESVSTRVVANYNHMHALSIQYYEVVQIYRVAVQLARVEKCIFVPMRLIDFNNPKMVRLFHLALAGAAVDRNASTLLSTNFDTVEVKAAGTIKLNLKNPFGFPAQLKADRQIIELPNDSRLQSITVFRSRGGFNDLKPLTTLNASLRDNTVANFLRASTSTSTKDDMTAEVAVPAQEIDQIIMESPPGPEDHKYLCEFMLKYKGGTLSFEGEILVEPGPPKAFLTFTGGGVRKVLSDHLSENRLHYSQAIFQSLDSSTVALLLSSYSYNGRPLMSQIDPQPVTVAGNYLVFKMHVAPNQDSNLDEERHWAKWLAEHGVSFDHTKEDLVPLPSGGVFAEAVLGRYNSAEKLDVTRFWNWQDSPIPLQAPEIAAIQTGSRGTTEDLKPGQFSQPLINIVNPTSLPDPVGMGAILSAIANGNMFRDMSGLAATVGLAQAGLQATSEGAGRAGAQAGANLVTAAQKEVEMAKTAVAAMQAMMGNSSAQSGSGANISQQGAMINHGKNLDTRRVGGGAASSGGGMPAITDGGSGGSSSGGGAAGSKVSGSGGGSNEVEATRAALWPGLGESPGQFLQNAVDLQPTGDEIELGGAREGGGTIPVGGLKIPIYTSANSFDLGWIRMTKRHLFVVADIRIEPTTADADKPSSFGITPSTGKGGLEFPPQPGQNRKPGEKTPMRWHALGPSRYRWEFWRGPSATDAQGRTPPVRSSLVGTLTVTESDTWPSDA